MADSEVNREHDAALADEEEAATVQLDYALVASVHSHHGNSRGKLSIAEVEAKAVENHNYHGFQVHLSKHMENHFKKCPEELPLANGAPTTFEGSITLDSLIWNAQVLLYERQLSVESSQH
ncbi:hypothetical protein F5146DRAFT_1002195 [Armillaria mellea]|nr:hypothetical protein F5146DRAFT_1002195 [Armillaria mellea]